MSLISIHVAPLVGAWIETIIAERYSQALLSNPLWVSGVKLFEIIRKAKISRSHPSWVRGLKRSIGKNAIIGHLVAPLVGAWIET